MSKVGRPKSGPSGPEDEITRLRRARERHGDRWFRRRRGETLETYKERLKAAAKAEVEIRARGKMWVARAFNALEDHEVKKKYGLQKITQTSKESVINEMIGAYLENEADLKKWFLSGGRKD